MNFWSLIREDFRANSANTKGKFIVLSYRLSNYFFRHRKNPLLFLLGIPFRFFYKFILQWLMGIEIGESAQIGKGLCVFHGQGLVVNESTIIGNYATLRHNTTIGNKVKGGKSPVFGNHVDIGANCVILGEITIGNNVIIGAGSVVIKDLPSNVIAAGNPVRIIRETEKKEL